MVTTSSLSPLGTQSFPMVKIIFQAKHQYLGVSLVSSRNTILRPLSRERKRIYRMVLLLLASLRQIIHFCLSGWLLLVMVINCLPVHSLTSWSYCFCFQKKKKKLLIFLSTPYITFDCFSPFFLGEIVSIGVTPSGAMPLHFWLVGALCIGTQTNSTRGRFKRPLLWGAPKLRVITASTFYSPCAQWHSKSCMDIDSLNPHNYPFKQV